MIEIEIKIKTDDEEADSPVFKSVEEAIEFLESCKEGLKSLNEEKNE